MSDSDDDYMSDKLLGPRDDQDIRPGLLFNRTQKRTHEIYKKKVEERAKRPKSYHEQEQETREKGLNTAISSDNIGFKLLQKMGYKEGKGLGKSDAGLKEPINVTLKESTSGMGREKHLEKVKQKKEKLKEDTLKLREREYLTSRYERTMQNTFRKDFFKAQRICEELDEREGITEPEFPYFWTKQAKKPSEDSSEDSESESEEEIITEENLESIIDYLRERHLYCLYCCLKGTDQEDLKTNCPGPYRTDHDDEL